MVEFSAAQIHSCYHCEKREIGCHAICEKYISQRKEADKKLEMVRRKRQTNNDAKGVLIKKKRKH